nr:MAG TPA: hypothetical protein [Caudoviricetes sp.]
MTNRLPLCAAPCRRSGIFTISYFDTPCKSCDVSFCLIVEVQ